MSECMTLRAGADMGSLLGWRAKGYISRAATGTGQLGPHPEVRAQRASKDGQKLRLASGRSFDTRSVGALLRMRPILTRRPVCAQERADLAHREWHAFL